MNKSIQSDEMFDGDGGRNLKKPVNISFDEMGANNNPNFAMARSIDHNDSQSFLQNEPASNNTIELPLLKPHQSVQIDKTSITKKNINNNFQTP